MGSECKRDRKRGTLGILQTLFIERVLIGFGVSKPRPVPAASSLHFRYASEGETMVDAPFLGIVESLMWIANQTRSDIASAARAIARSSYLPKLTCYQAAQKILENVNATSDL